MQREQLVQMPLGWGVLGYATGREQTVWLGHMEEREGSWKGVGSQRRCNPGVTNTQQNQRSFPGTLSVCSTLAQLSHPSVAS